MEGFSVTLENHSETIMRADEALDFNFNEADDPSDTEKNVGAPFVHHLKSPLRPMDLLIFEGTVQKYAKGFKIDLCSWKNDIVFHINPRLDQNYIARNSWTEGVWGCEESCSSTKSPITRGEAFQLHIFLIETEFKVSINGVHMFDFAHRFPYQEISRIEIFGDVDVGKVALEKTSVYPLSANGELVKRPLINFELPLSLHMKYGLGYFRKILIEGRVKFLPHSFTINVQTSDQVYPHPLIIYHLNGRYAMDSIIVENSWGLRRGGWDLEVRSPMPLALGPGSSFSLTITTNNSFIQTSGLDWELPPFPHRFSPENGLFLKVQGDIIVTSIKVSPDEDTMSVF